MSQIKLLSNDINQIYSLIYKECWNQRSLPAGFFTREEKYANRRHIVRYMVQRERACTYTDIAKAEAMLFGIKPAHHTTIMNSIQAVKSTLRGQPEYKKLIHRISFFYDVRKSGKEFRHSLNKFMNLPPHVLAIVLSSIAEHGLVNRSILQTLINEYEQVDIDTVNSILNQTKVQHA